MLVRREVERAAVVSDPAVEAPQDEDASRNASEPDSASLRSQGAVSLPEMVKPTPVVKQRASAATGLSGVVGDGGHRQINRGTWEARRDGPDQRRPGRHNRTPVPPGVGEAHSSVEAG